MTWVNEPNNHNDGPKKSDLLPTGDKAKEIVEVLVEMYLMYLVMHNPEDIANDDTGVESANH